ncbi:MAG TPA: isoprenylcysteine carboxylmethyltransferase family protein [Myxococcales bacterium]|jgi:protein-S-isoprenylcysteine O-methyltransferase Ste14|nr:isoprenylcysteine carboxylmethyltransferase family protein [Myxococcales bacterium]
MSKLLTLLYAGAAYLFGSASLLYSIGWLGNVPGLPTTIDGQPGQPFFDALLVDVALLLLFAVQHSGMARPAFKKIWTRIVPEGTERATYVLLSGVCLFAICLRWQTLPGTVWHLDGPAAIAAWVLYAAGWVILFSATFMVNHADLFGLRQALLRFRSQPQRPIVFVERYFYRVIRHPIMAGLLIAFWSAPHMSSGRLAFALMTTTYIFVALQFEERDLRRELGATYTNYAARVPMLVPGLPRSGSPQVGNRSTQT